MLDESTRREQAGPARADGGQDGSPAWHQGPPHVRLIGLAAGKWISQCVYALARLGVPDLIAGGHRDADSIAAATGADPDRMTRLLRAGVAVGVLRESAEGTFTLTDTGEPLRARRRDSLRDFVLYMGDEGMLRPFGRLDETVRTGVAGYELVYGRPMFDDLAMDSARAQLYQRAWAPFTAELGAELARSYDFDGVRRVADLGGGTGLLLIMLLQAHPGLSGTLVDRPEALAVAEHVVQQAGLGSRLTLLAGDLASLPRIEADCYVLKNVLHCFDDETCRAALRGVRASISPGARLLVIEAVLADGGGFDWGTLIDIEVMCTTGGRERTAAQWRQLLAECGFEVVRITPATPPQQVIEAAPATA
jgi:hypothetical protein